MFIITTWVIYKPHNLIYTQHESEVSMENEKVLDTRVLEDAICQLKSYVKIMEDFIAFNYDNKDLNHIGIIVDKISEIVDNLEKEYWE